MVATQIFITGIKILADIFLVQFPTVPNMDFASPQPHKAATILQSTHCNIINIILIMMERAILVVIAFSGDKQKDKHKYYSIIEQ